MSEIILVLKDEEELPVPSAWRQIFFDIVEAFKAGDFQLEKTVDAIQPISDHEASRIAGNIADYGDQLVSLPDETWQTSIYRWVGNCWLVLIDLFTLEEGASDLVLFVQVKENKNGFSFTIESVHVP